jgi:hypothetical protein
MGIEGDQDEQGVQEQSECGNERLHHVEGDQLPGPEARLSDGAVELEVKMGFAIEKRVWFESDSE